MDAFDCSVKREKPYMFLQWKGTDACFDFHCPCGYDPDTADKKGGFDHFDGTTFGHYTCPGCKTVYKLSPFPEVRKMTREEIEDYKKYGIDLEE